MKRSFSLFALALAASAPVVTAQNDPTAGIAQLDVLPGWQTGAGTHMAGLRITLAPGWKTYWRAPGDAGIPPQMQIAEGGNIASSRLHWPTPEVFDQLGYQSIGYRDGVVLPLELTAERPGAPMRLSGKIAIGVCEEICVPMVFALDAALPAPGKREPAIVAALVDQPDSVSDATPRCAIAPIADGLAVTATLRLDPTGTPEQVVVESGDPALWISQAETTRSGDMLTARVEMVHLDGPGFALDRAALRFTVLGADRAVDIRGCAAG